MKFEATAYLSKESIDKLTKKLKDYQKDLQDAKKYILEALAEYTQQRAKYHLKKSLLHPDKSTGKLADSINIKYFSCETAKVYTNLFYAAYVEFGTGAVGASSEYGSKMFGDIDYKKEFQFGQPAHRYMYNATQDLKANYIKIAKKVLKERGLI